MITKICAKCETEKTLDEFHVKKDGRYGRHSYCKVCAIANAKQHYRENIKTVLPRNIEYARKYRRQIKNVIDSLKETFGCCSCFEKNAACLDMHHLDVGTKDDVISTLATRKNISKLVEELNKCICVCANCHRKIHAGMLEIVQPKKFDISLEAFKAMVDRSDIGLIGRNHPHIRKKT